MPSISLTQITNGQSGDATVVDNNFDTLADLVNGNLDSDNLVAGAIDSARIEQNAVTGDKLATNAIVLGYAEQAAVTGQTFTTSETDLTGLSVTVTVPSGGRRIRITTGILLRSSADGDGVDIRIKEGTTNLSKGRFRMSTFNTWCYMTYVSSTAPTAGSHTYKATGTRDSGSGTITNGTNVAPDQSFILVELI